MQKAPDIFISHSSEDKAIAGRMCAALEADGTRCWIAPRDIAPGDVYAEAILAAIAECRIMVVVFSSHANQSAQVLREVERAVSSGRILILTFRVESLFPTGAMEFFLSSHHWIDAFSPPIERHLEVLGRSVQRILGGAPEKPRETSADEAWDAPLATLRASIDASRRVKIDEFIASVREDLEARRFDTGVVADIACVLWELTINAAEHGCQFKPSERIRVACEIRRTHVCLSVKNAGPGFSADQTMRRLSEHYDVNQPRGRGLMLVRCLCKSVTFRDEGRCAEAVITIPAIHRVPGKRKAWRPKQVIDKVVVLMIPEDSNEAIDVLGPEIDMMRDLSYRKFAFDWELPYTIGKSCMMTVFFLQELARIQQAGGAVAFFNVNGQVYAALKKFRFTDLFPVKYSLQDALLHLK